MTWPLVLLASLLLYGAGVLARRYVQCARMRRAADEWVARGYEGRAAWYGWRIAELTGARERRLLACSVQHVSSELSDPRAARLSPLNRRELRPQKHLIDRLSN